MCIHSIGARSVTLSIHKWSLPTWTQKWQVTWTWGWRPKPCTAFCANKLSSGSTHTHAHTHCLIKKPHPDINSVAAQFCWVHLQLEISSARVSAISVLCSDVTLVILVKKKLTIKALYKQRSVKYLTGYCGKETVLEELCESPVSK